MLESSFHNNAGKTTTIVQLNRRKVGDVVSESFLPKVFQDRRDFNIRFSYTHTYKRSQRGRGEGVYVSSG